MAANTRSACSTRAVAQAHPLGPPSAASTEAMVLPGCRRMPPACHRLGERRAQILVEAAQRQGLAVDQVDLGAQAGEDAGELDGDVAAAEQHDAARQVLQEERVVGDDAVLGAGEPGPQRAAAGGDDDALGGDARAADIERVRVDEASRGRRSMVQPAPSSRRR